MAGLSNALVGCGRLFLNCAKFFGKANRVLLLAAEETNGSSLQRSKLSLHLRCRPCKGRLKNFIALKTLISDNKISLERIKRFIEESLSAASIAEDYQSNAGLSDSRFARYTART